MAMHALNKGAVLALAWLLLPVLGYGQAADSAAAGSTPVGPSVETLVCVRHGEKYVVGQTGGHDIGQLDPQGLNRALALPKVLLGKYGKPQFIFAPNPAAMIGSKDGSEYCYVRPLATIEPTAIACELPVDTRFGFQDIQGLETELRKPVYANATVFVAWEHNMLEKFVRQTVVDLGGNGADVPVWDPTMKFDAIYVVKITKENGHSTVTFSVDHEGLDNQSQAMPGPATP